MFVILAKHFLFILRSTFPCNVCWEPQLKLLEHPSNVHYISFPICVAETFQFSCTYCLRLASTLGSLVKRRQNIFGQWGLLWKCSSNVFLLQGLVHQKMSLSAWHGRLAWGKEKLATVGTSRLETRTTGAIRKTVWSSEIFVVWYLPSHSGMNIYSASTSWRTINPHTSLVQSGHSARTSSLDRSFQVRLYCGTLL